MGRFHVIYIVLSLIMLIGNVQSIHFHRGKEKAAKFRVYLHGLTIGSNATVVEVGRADATSTSASSFGWVRVTDNLMTVGPDASSKELGRAQGFLLNTDTKEFSISINLNFVFTRGEYKGSTLSVVGRKSMVRRDEEMPIVGGTNVFRWARGFSISSNYSYDATTGINILRYDMYVVYKD